MSPQSDPPSSLRGPASALRGRGTALNPANRFEAVEVELDLDALDWEDRENFPARKVKTRVFLDRSKSVLSRNDSPDVPFTFSVNPYRGCEHGCVYCYARPTHEYLGLSAGLDFETQIFAKPDAPLLLAREFESRKWEPQTVALSGNTDCYQPAEKHFGITRALLQTFLDYGNPVGIITKSAMITRDLDILQQLAAKNLVTATLSITTLDPELARRMEPRAASPAKRLAAIERLADAGVSVSVNAAPMIPGLNDHELPGILAAAAERGADAAGYVLLRLPFAVKDLFIDWLGTHYPQRRDKVLHAIQDARGGELSDARYGTRMSGEGERAETIQKLFQVSCKKLGLNRRSYELDTTRFRRRGSGQQEFELG
jgi:DNA repair photolyase